MSLPPSEHCVSNPRRRLAVITVIILIVLASPTCAKVVGAYSDTVAVYALCLAASGTAARYRNYNSRPRPQPSV